MIKDYSIHSNPFFNDTLNQQPSAIPEHHNIEHLPNDIKHQLKPHHTQWLDIKSQEPYRYSRSDNLTHLFIKDKKHWVAVTSFVGYQQNEKKVLKHKNSFTTDNNQAPAFAGSYNPNTLGKPLTLEQATHQAKQRERIRRAKEINNNPYGNYENDNYHIDNNLNAFKNPFTQARTYRNTLKSEANIKIDAKKQVDKEQRKVILQIEYATPQTDKAEPLAFAIKGSNGYKISRNNNNTENAAMVYGRLKPQDHYQLNETTILSKKATIIPLLPFDDWLSAKKLIAANVGANGGYQLLNHQVSDGNLPSITLLTQPPQFGVFFDGTGNNKLNDNVNQTDDKEPTNITKLSELYLFNSYSGHYYAEGIGTQAGKKDNMLDMGLAFSLDERINKTLKEMVIFFEEFSNCKVGFVDIFGFSRGATQARMLVNVIHYLNQHQPNYWGGCKLVVRFLGVFDTVGSVGLAGDKDNRWFAATGKLPGAPKTATLDIHPNSVCAAYHLMALDEQRKNFPLSRLAQQNTPLPSHIIEEGCFGAHADIGGGYSALPQNLRYPSTTVKRFYNEPEQHTFLAKLKAELEHTYYQPGIHITFEVKKAYKSQHGKARKASHLRITPYWKRDVDHSLAYISLAKMHKHALQQGVPFQPLTELENVILQQRGRNGNTKFVNGYAYKVPEKLTALITQATQAGINNTQSNAYKILYQHYIHHSHSFVKTITNGINKNPNNRYGNGQRESFYSDNQGLHANEQWQRNTLGYSGTSPLTEQWIKD